MTEIVVVTVDRAITNWMQEARWVIGLDFIAHNVRAGIRSTARQLIREGKSVRQVKTTMFKTLYRYSRSDEYNQKRNDLAWNKLVAPRREER